MDNFKVQSKHMDTKRNYDEKAGNKNNQMQREISNTFELKAFNNWIKAVLIQSQTKNMCQKVEAKLDLKRGGDQRILHVLDIGCGRGQDIKKWKQKENRVQYIVAVDFSEECIKEYENRWRSEGQPYRLLTISQDFTSPDFYSRISHSFYDVVSAQLCFHYMFQTEKGLNLGLTTILSNLLVGGVFIATIPDSYAIIKKLKERGTKQTDGTYIFSNNYCSIKMSMNFSDRLVGNEYGFYLEQALGKKNQNGQIEYTKEWLIELDSLARELKNHGVVIEETMNFLEYYLKYRNIPEYKDLFPKFKLNFREGESIKEQLWEIAHLYRVLICRKQKNGKQIRQFNLDERKKAMVKEIKRNQDFGNHYDKKGQSRSRDHYNRGNRDKHYRNDRM